jgi:hypothetical protein
MKILFPVLFILMCVAPDIMAQGGGVSVKVNNVELKGKALNLDADIRIGHINVGRYESVSLTFVLKGTGRGQTLALPPVVLCGANKYQMYRRAIALHGAAEARNGAYAVLKNVPEVIQYQAYKRAVPYKAWMSNCQLILIREVKNYHNNTVESSSSILSRKLAIRSSATTGRQQAAPANRPPTYNLPPATNPPANNRTNNTPARTNTPANRVNPATRPATTRPATTTPASANRRVNSVNNNRR